MKIKNSTLECVQGDKLEPPAGPAGPSQWCTWPVLGGQQGYGQPQGCQELWLTFLHGRPCFPTTSHPHPHPPSPAPHSPHHHPSHYPPPIPSPHPTHHPHPTPTHTHCAGFCLASTPPGLQTSTPHGVVCLKTNMFFRVYIHTSFSILFTCILFVVLRMNPRAFSKRDKHPTPKLVPRPWFCF